MYIIKRYTYLIHKIYILNNCSTPFLFYSKTSILLPEVFTK